MSRASRLAGAVAILVSATVSEAALLARWAFDESADETVAVDSAGSIDGTLQGSAVFVPGAGVSGGAVSLDSATADRVNTGDKFSFAGNPTFSLQVWVNITSMAGHIVVGRHTTGFLNRYAIALNDISDGPPGEAAGSCHFYQSDVPQHNSGDVDLDDGDWHQILVARDASAGQHRLAASRLDLGPNLGTRLGPGFFNELLAAGPFMSHRPHRVEFDWSSGRTCGGGARRARLIQADPPPANSGGLRG